LFTERVVSVWNSLPNAVDFNSLAVFRRTMKFVNSSSHLCLSCHTDVSTGCGQLAASVTLCLAVLFDCYLILHVILLLL